MPYDILEPEAAGYDVLEPEAAAPAEIPAGPSTSPVVPQPPSPFPIIPEPTFTSSPVDSIRAATLLERVRMTPTWQRLFGPPAAEEEYLRSQGRAVPVTPAGIVNWGFRQATLPPPAANLVRQATQPLVNLVPGEGPRGVVEGAREFALGFPAPLAKVSFGKNLGKVVMGLFAGEFALSAPDAAAQFNAAMQAGNYDLATQIATQQALTGAVLGAGALAEVPVRRPAAAAAPVTPAPAAAVAPKAEVPSAVQVRETTPVLRGVPEQPVGDVGQVPAQESAVGVPRGVQASQGAGRPEVPLKPVPEDAFEEVDAGEFGQRWFVIKKGRYTSTDGGTYGPGSGVSEGQMRMLGFEPPPAPPKGTVLRSPDEAYVEFAPRAEPVSPAAPVSPPVPIAAKEPWQKTREEYEQQGRGLPEGSDLVKRASEASKRVRESAKAIFEQSGYWKRNRIKDLETRRTTIGALHEFEPHTVETALRSPKVKREAKDAYRAAVAAYKEIARQAEIEADHRTYVERALREGKPVPAEVLAEYPELQKSITTPGTSVAGRGVVSSETTPASSGSPAAPVSAPVEKAAPAAAFPTKVGSEFGDLYHGSTKEISGPLKAAKAREDIKTGIYGKIKVVGSVFKGVFLAKDKSYAAMYAAGQPEKVSATRLSPDAKVLSLPDIVSEEVLTSRGWGRERGLTTLPQPSKPFPFQAEFERYALDRLNYERVANGKEKLSPEAFSKRTKEEWDPAKPGYDREELASKYLPDFIKEKGYDAVEFGREVVVINPKALVSGPSEVKSVVSKASGEVLGAKATVETAALEAPADPISTLASAPAVKVTLPKEARVLPGKGTPAIRGTDAKGRTSDQPASVFAKGNPFQNAGITKIEAGYIDRATKKFVPVKGDVGVEIPKPRVAKPQALKKAPAAPVAPTTPEAAADKMQTEVAKTAAVAGKPSAAKVKRTLVEFLDEEIGKAPAAADLTPEQQAALKGLEAVSYTATDEISGRKQMDAILAAMAAGLNQVSIDIPGDGTVATWGVKEVLTKVRDAAKRLKTAPEKGPLPPTTPENVRPLTPRQRAMAAARKDIQDALTVYGTKENAYNRLHDQLRRVAELELPPQQVARLRRLVATLSRRVLLDETGKAIPEEPAVARPGPGAMSPTEAALRTQHAEAGMPPAIDVPAIPSDGNLMQNVVRPPKDFNLFNRANSPQWTFWFGKLGEAAKAAWQRIALGEFSIRSGVGKDVERYVNNVLSSLPRQFRRQSGKMFSELLDGRTMESIEQEWTGRPQGDRVIAAAREVKTKLEEYRVGMRDAKREQATAALLAMKKDTLIDMFRENVDPTLDVSAYTKQSLADAIVRVEFPDDWGIADGSYFPHTFFGNWRVTAQLAGEAEPRFVGRAQSVSEATAQMRDFVKSNPEYARAVWQVERGNIIPGDMIRLGDRRFWKLISDLKDKTAADFDIRGALRGVIGRNATRSPWFGHQKARQGFGGYSKDYRRVMSAYIHGWHRWMELSKVSREVYPLIEQVRREGRTAAAEELTNLLDYVWGKPAKTTVLFDNFVRQIPGVRDVIKPLALDRWSRNARRLVSTGTLSTIRFSIVNRLQPLQGLYPLIGEKALLEAKLMQHSAFGRRLLDEAGLRFDPGQWGVEGAPLTRLRRVKERFTGETTNQELAFLAMYRLARKQGLDHTAAMNYGRLRGQLFTQFSPIKADIPPLFRGPGMGLLFQFKRFPIKSLELGMRMVAERRFGGLARLFAVMAVMGGAQFYLRQFLTPSTFRKNIHDKLVEQVGEDASDYLLYGLPNLIGADISGSLTLGDEPFGQSLYEKVGRQLVGPAVSITYETAKAARTARRVPLTKTEEIETTLRRYPALRPISELIALARGDVDIRSPDGEVRYRRTIGDALRGVAALRSAKESEITMYTDWMVAMKKESDDLQNNLFVEMSRENGDVEGAMDAIQKFNARWPEFMLTPNDIHRYLANRRRDVDKTDVERLAGRRYRSILSELEQEE